MAVLSFIALSTPPWNVETDEAPGPSGGSLGPDALIVGANP
jgi:hypothetical protein